ncbi:protein O-mannosyl-transferase Tmtc3-like [Tachypleus tridentatus]|uniref:protein O-mannosyl-transferase Tmtc3-like n=2 Tax=Tachypleus tridentatus TaxID=6853 RepID=UPI003FD1A25F
MTSLDSLYISVITSLHTHASEEEMSTFRKSSARKDFIIVYQEVLNFRVFLASLSEKTLFLSGLKINPSNAKLHNNVGKVLEAEYRHQEALLYYNQAITLQPNDVRGFLNAGRVLTYLKRYQEAEDSYRKAKNMLPQVEDLTTTETHVTNSHLQVFLSLASLLSRNTSRLEEADALYREAIRLRSDYMAAYLNRGDVLLKLNRSKEAENMYVQALRFDSNNPNLYYNLGVVLMDQRRRNEALILFNRTLELEPEHKEALFNMAMLLQGWGKQTTNEEVNRRLHVATEGVRHTKELYFALGTLALENGNSLSAERWFRKAVETNPSDRSALFNLALLLTKENKHSEALDLLKQLLKYHSDHVKGLLLLGDIYITQMKNLDEAELCYQKILEVDPHNVQGLHNLCVVYLHRGHLEQAEQCFLQALQLAPSADYISHHLRLVRSQILKQTQPVGIPQSDVRHLNSSGSVR